MPLSYLISTHITSALIVTLVFLVYIHLVLLNGKFNFAVGFKPVKSVTWIRRRRMMSNDQMLSSPSNCTENRKTSLNYE